MCAVFGIARNPIHPKTIIILWIIDTLLSTLVFPINGFFTNLIMPLSRVNCLKNGEAMDDPIYMKDRNKAVDEFMRETDEYYQYREWHLRPGR